MILLPEARVGRAIEHAEPLRVEGRVRRATGLILEASLPNVAIGTACDVRSADGRIVQAEVVGFSGATALLMPVGEMRGIGDGAVVIPRGRAAEVPAGDGLLGRVVDARMRPVDGLPAILLSEKRSIDSSPPPAMSRRRIAQPLVTGIRAIDTLLTLGEGQRVGIMAGPGVGKSVLLGMLAKSAAADVIVVALVGERGREVREFVERDLGEGRKRAVVVVATADEPPLVRVRAAMAATAVAEHFRDAGKRVLLLMDSLTRFAMAQREIGLAAGEPPTSKGYPPSVFAALPRLVERAGNCAGEGSITAMYTVLAEGDDLADPVVDASRAALDGHYILSRKLAGSGHFPAIDVLGSVSRVMSDVVDRRHLEQAQAARELLGTYRDAADLVEVGAYVAGSNPRIDRAVAANPLLQQFLRQPPDERTPLETSMGRLERIVGGEGSRR